MIKTFILFFALTCVVLETASAASPDKNKKITYKGFFKSEYDEEGRDTGKPLLYLPTYENGILSLKLSNAALSEEAATCQNCHDCCCGWKDPSSKDCDSCFYPYDCWNDWSRDCKPKPPPPTPPTPPSGNCSCCGSVSEATGGSSSSGGSNITTGDSTSQSGPSNSTAHNEVGLGQLISNATNHVVINIQNNNIPFNGDVTSCTTGCVNNDLTCLSQCESDALSCTISCEGQTDIAACLAGCVALIGECTMDCTFSSEKCMENCSFSPIPPTPALSASFIKEHMDNLENKIERRIKYFKKKHNIV